MEPMAGCPASFLRKAKWIILAIVSVDLIAQITKIPHVSALQPTYSPIAVVKAQTPQSAIKREGLLHRDHLVSDAGFPIADNLLRSFPIPDTQQFLQPFAVQRALYPDRTGAFIEFPQRVGTFR
jgi:hypothetical protein